VKLIYFSPVPWESITQRPHEFVNFFHARTSAAVIWVDPYPTRLPQFRDLFRLKNQEKNNSRELPHWLTVLHASCLPVEPIWWLRFVNLWFFSRLLRRFSYNSVDYVVIGKPSLLALYTLEKLQPAISLYDAMDDFPEFYSGISAKSMAKVEFKIGNAAKKVIVSSTNLRKKFRDFGIETQLILNACSAGNINKIKQENIELETKKILGYVGTIAQWFDWDFVCALANSNLNFDVHLIGPVIGTLPVYLPPNIKIFPPVNHEIAIQLMVKFHAGLIPFKRDRLTNCVDPIKYYEYKACGLPIISSDFGEMSYRKDEAGVYIIDSISDLKNLDARTLEPTNPKDTFSWQDRFSKTFYFSINKNISI